MPGAVAAGHPCSASAGATLLAQGGNAVDACVASVLAAFVAEGPLTGPAGGGFALVCEPGCDPVLIDCFFTVPGQPGGAMEELVIDFADASTQIFHIGEESVAVPGLVAGLELVHRRFGRLPWVELAGPALELARHGIDVVPAQRFLHEILVPILQREAMGRRIYGDPDRVDASELVPALEAIRDHGAAAVAVLLPELAADLAAYHVVERTPLHAAVGDYRLATAPQPSVGGAVVRDALARLVTARSAADRAEALRAAYGALAVPTRPTGTTHVSVIDGEGRVAAISSTLGSGSGVFRNGFQLNNMLGELDVIGPGPYAAGVRLPSMMAPTLLHAAGTARLVLGSAGSVRLAGAIAQVAAAVLGGASVDDAVDRPRLHVEGHVAHVEGGSPDGVAASLADAGYAVNAWSGRNLFFGGVSAVERRPDGTLAAAGDPRRGGHGMVVP